MIDDPPPPARNANLVFGAGPGVAEPRRSHGWERPARYRGCGDGAAGVAATPRAAASMAGMCIPDVGRANR